MDPATACEVAPATEDQDPDEPCEDIEAQEPEVSPADDDPASDDTTPAGDQSEGLLTPGAPMARPVDEEEGDGPDEENDGTAD